MKEFSSLRPYNSRIKMAEEKGWFCYTDERLQERMCKSIIIKGKPTPVDVCIRSMGRFFVYSKQKCISSEISKQFDDCEWYSEILSIIYC